MGRLVIVFIMGLALGAALVLLIEDLQRLIRLGDVGEVVAR